MKTVSLAFCVLVALVTSFAATTTALSVPAAPTNLRLTGAAEGLAWTDNSTDETGIPAAPPLFRTRRINRMIKTVCAMVVIPALFALGGCGGAVGGPTPTPTSERSATASPTGDVTPAVNFEVPKAHLAYGGSESEGFLVGVECRSEKGGRSADSFSEEAGVPRAVRAGDEFVLIAGSDSVGIVNVSIFDPLTRATVATPGFTPGPSVSVSAALPAGLYHVQMRAQSSECLATYRFAIDVR